MTLENAPAAQIALAEAAAKAATAAQAAVPAAGAPARPVRFVGEGRAFWRIQLRGAMLLAVTLGIYRFWLATDVRRFLWSNTEIAGQSLEYNGTATELLIGFLVAIALLVPINLGFFVLALGLGSFGEAVSMLGFPALFVLGQFAFFRARRYRLTRTVLRGVRFHQTGSAWRYAVTATLWWVLIVFTLGLAYPFAQASLERYKMRHTHYGDLPGRFEGSGARLFGRGIFMWFLVVAPLVFGIVAALGAVHWASFARVMETGNFNEDFGLETNWIAALVTGGVAVSVSILLAALLFPIFQAMTLRWWLSGIRFGALALHSDLLKRKIFGAYLSFLWRALVFSLLAALVGFFGVVGFGALSVALGPAATEISGALAAVAFYVAVMLGYSAIYQATVKLALWRHSAESVAIEGLAVLDRVKAVGRPSSAIGEGLADALNVGGI